MNLVKQDKHWIRIIFLLLVFSATLLPANSAFAQSDSTNPVEAAASSMNVADDATSSPPVDEKETVKRLKLVGISILGLITMLTILFCYLRLNHATRGFYSRRLQAGAALAAIVIAALCYFLYFALT